VTAHHQNNGKCPKCQEILKDAHPDLRAWFEKEQSADPELHCSCSKRGRADQAAAKEGGFSKAAYGESPHNYAPSWAIDLFFIVNGTAAWVLSRYAALAKRKPASVIWGADWNDNGRTDDEKFRDSPHFEIHGWRKLEPRFPKGSA
jgi:peptidoglycan L-alanyl-D-glutamate endopeptidase CwlK